MRGKTRLTAAVSTVALATTLLTGVAAAAPGHTYHVDNRGTCDNNGAATTSLPWCDFTPVNARTFTGGEEILLARGAVWNQQLNLRGTGTAAAPVTLAAYGSGARPHIRRNGVAEDRGVLLTDPTHWRVSNLEVSRAGAGIVAYFSTLGHEGLTFTDIFTHDITGITRGDCGRTGGIFSSAGIQITGDRLRFTARQYALRNVLLRDIEGTRNHDSVSFDWCNGLTGADGHDGNSLVQGVVLDGLNLHEDAGAGGECHDGLRLVNMRHVVLMNSVLHKEAGCHSPSGTAAVFLGRVLDVSFVNSIVTAVPHTGSPDQAGFDHEVVTDSVKIRNNLIADNAGPGVEYLAIYPQGDHSRNHELSGNLLLNNAKAQQPSHLGGVTRIGHLSRPTGSVHDNLHFEPTGFTGVADGGEFDGFTFRDNAEVHSVADTAHAPSAFADRPRAGWSYQHSATGFGWQNLTFDPASGTYRGPAGASVARFTQTPADEAGWTARAWTAPREGTVAVRSRALKAEVGGDGVEVRITHNGHQLSRQRIEPNDLQGLVLDVPRLAVRAGDVLRFEVNRGAAAGADRVSWAPAIGYLAEPSRWWRFDRDTEGWQPWHQLTGSVRAGILTMEASGEDPFLFSPAGLGLAANGRNFVEARLRNSTPGGAAQLYFITEDDPVWSDDKQLTVPVPARDSLFQLVRFEVGGHPKWRGRISQLRLDPSVAAGRSELDYLRVG
ncbi:hypothetical protein N8J89_00375 [Crossiella sp. CA-258035]|uniref:hypothetical protein n=1 Tax=Crossiella sp. CA-258035 TaxID=2981138 RepID=UPI0024BC24C8|nr:hypothetical protein [Crossiella sp. CA-258035]WHT19591.1 hypothetical protein N8J89_00375 [Crossiella sp. CA-258035]